MRFFYDQQQCINAEFQDTPVDIQLKRGGSDSNRTLYVLKQNY
jgi:hypothetical protein